MVFRDGSITVNAIDLSTRCDTVTIEDAAEEVDETAFQGNGYRAFVQGLKDATITAAFFQSFVTGSVHDTLQALYDSGGTFDVVVKATDAVVSPTNPSFTMTARLYTYGGLAGSVGESLKVEATFRNAGGGITTAIA